MYSILRSTQLRGRSALAWSVASACGIASVAQETKVPRPVRSGAFVDTIVVRCASGAGGDGCASFLRDVTTARGPPNGGNGGRGGSVFIVPQEDGKLSKISTSIRAGRGEHGRGSYVNGKWGKDVYIKVPPGTVVRELTDPPEPVRMRRSDIQWRMHPGALGMTTSQANLREAETIALRHIGRAAPAEKIAIDFATAQHEPVLLCSGGIGGLGNAMFVSKDNRVPAYATRGLAGQERTFVIELKSIADIGLVGMPNAGKSTFLNTVSRAKSRIASWQFTTLSPHIGTITVPRLAGGDEFRFSVADIPGLIEGASAGRGLGHDFLRHVERASTLAYVVALSDDDPGDTFLKLRNELREYNPSLLRKRTVVLANKADLPDTEAKLASLSAAVTQSTTNTLIVPMSAKTGLGFDRIILALADIVRCEREAAAARETEHDDTSPRWLT